MSNRFDKHRKVRDISNVGQGLHDTVLDAWWTKHGSPRGNAEMSEGSNKGAAPETPVVTGDLEALASRALSIVASNRQVKSIIDPELFSALLESLTSLESDTRRTVIDRMLEAGVSRNEIVDIYLPAAAHHLGNEWCEDEKSFADVTIGSARLQAMIRDLDRPAPAPLNAPAVLVIAPDDAYHTLGPTILADQMRRYGVTVRLALGLTSLSLSKILQTADFDAILISAAASERLEKVRELVNTIRRDVVPNPPICVGGSVLDQEIDIRLITGADHITNSAREALHLCGLTIQTPDAVSPGLKG